MADDDSDSDAWQQKRRDAADEHLAALDRRKAVESQQAAEHVKGVHPLNATSRSSHKEPPLAAETKGNGPQDG